MDFRGKTVVVTGAGGGIGREVALQLLRVGANVAAVDVRDELLAELAHAAGESSSRVSQHVVDITDHAAVSALPEAVSQVHGTVDALINVAGIIHRFVPLSDLTVEEVERVMAVNFFGTLHTLKAFLPLLTARPSACVVNVASMGGLVPSPGQSAYGASKAAVRLLTDALFVELAGTSVDVRLVVPGSIATNIAGNSGVDVADLVVRAVRADSSPQVTGAREAGRQLVEALEGDEYRIFIGNDARVIDEESRRAPVETLTIIASRAQGAVS